jgi:muramidase (phage lysozyme)
MALGNMLAGVGGFFDGWKAMDDIINSHQKMLARQEQIEGYQKGKELADAQEKVRDAMRADPTFGVDPDAPQTGTTGSSTPPVVPPGAEVPEYKAGSSGSRAVSSTTADTTLPPEARSFLDTISGPESGGAYNARWPGKTFSSYDSHPRIYEPGPQGPSSAAGRYQITATTYDELANKYGLKDFKPETQDFAAWKLAEDTYRQRTGGDLLTALREGKTQDVQQMLRGRWPTLNMASYANNMRKYGGDAAGGGSALPEVPDYGSALGGSGTTTPAPSAPTASNRITVPPPSALNVSPAPAPMPPRVVSKGVMPPGGLVTPDDYARFLGKPTPALSPGSGGCTPTMPGYGAGGNNPYNTSLQPTQEAAFRNWVKNNKVKFNPDADMTDYDMRGFWQAMQQGDPRAVTSVNPDLNEVHYPDFWKTPIHKTFSNESQFAPPGAPRWSNGQLISNDGTVLVDERANALGQ